MRVNAEEFTSQLCPVLFKIVRNCFGYVLIRENNLACVASSAVLFLLFPAAASSFLPASRIAKRREREKMTLFSEVLFCVGLHGVPLLSDIRLGT